MCQPRLPLEIISEILQYDFETALSIGFYNEAFSTAKYIFDWTPYVGNVYAIKFLDRYFIKNVKKLDLFSSMMFIDIRVFKKYAFQKQVYPFYKNIVKYLELYKQAVLCQRLDILDFLNQKSIFINLPQDIVEFAFFTRNVKVVEKVYKKLTNKGYAPKSHVVDYLVEKDSIHCLKFYCEYFDSKLEKHHIDIAKKHMALDVLVSIENNKISVNRKKTRFSKA